MSEATPLIRGYIGIENDTLWRIITDDVPVLLKNLRTLKNAVDSGHIQ